MPEFFQVSAFYKQPVAPGIDEGDSTALHLLYEIKSDRLLGDADFYVSGADLRYRL